MWTLILILGLTTLLLVWTCFGYFLVARLIGVIRARRPAPDLADADLPEISVVVPCYNERATIEHRLANLLALEYPVDRLEVVFADGGSTDGTVEWLAQNLPRRERFRVVACPRSGKIQQLNHVLPTLSGAIIVNSDADAELGCDALKRIAAWFAADPRVAVVGAASVPSAGLPMDRFYWLSQNKGRFIESEAWGVSIVVAVGYAFRRDLLTAFPEDVVADDIYVAFAAISRGFESLYVRDVTAFESRGPGSLSELVAHKYRKANAFLRESLRFVYRLPEMPLPARLMLLTRIAQQLLLPWAVLLWGLLLGTLATLFRFDIVIIDLVVVGLVFAATSLMFAGVPVPEGHERRVGLLDKIQVYVFTLSILLLTGATYPFFRQGSSYARVGGPGPGDGGGNAAEPPPAPTSGAPFRSPGDGVEPGPQTSTRREVR